MKSISELIENYKQNKFKKHTLICYLSTVFSLSKKAIIDLVSENEINISENEIYEILRAYAILTSSHKVASSLQEKLKIFSFLDRINLLVIAEEYLEASFIDCTDEEILIIKKIPIEDAEKSFLEIQDENNIIINESNFSLQAIPDDKLQDIYLTLDDISQKLKITPKELLKTFKRLGWIEKNGLFSWTTTIKAKDLGVLSELNDIKKEKIWPVSLLDYQEFNNLFVSNNEILRATNKQKLISSIDDIMHPQFNHENTFKKYISLVFSKDIKQDIIGDIIDMYYDLYDPDGPNKIYEIYFDKYTELYEEFENIGDYFLSLDEIDSLNSDQIIKMIEMKTSLSTDEETNEPSVDNENNLLSTKELSQKIDINYNEILSILSGLELIEFHDKIWNITSKANELGAKHEQDQILWKIEVVDYIIDECKLVLLKMFKDSNKIDEIFKTITDSERKQFVNILNQVI